MYWVAEEGSESQVGLTKIDESPVDGEKKTGESTDDSEGGAAKAGKRAL